MRAYSNRKSSYELIQVAIPLPIDQLFVYRSPAKLEERSRPGCRAVVPLGNRIVTGVIVGKSSEPPLKGQLREVIDLPDDEPLLSAELLDLTHWIKEYYFCSWGEAIKAALPAGSLQTGQRRIKLVDGKDSKYTPANEIERQIYTILLRGGSDTPGSLTNKYGIPDVLTHLMRMEKSYLVKIEECSPGGGISVLKQMRIKLGDNLTATDLLTEAKKRESRSPAQARILKIVGEHSDGLAIPALLERSGATRAALGTLVTAGLLKSEKTEIKRYPTLEALTVKDNSPLPTLNTDQQRAIAEIAMSLDQGGYRTFLLYGVTGSGKTLVYQKAIEEVLKMGGTALVLIPEISLTPQIVGRFRAHFGDRIGLQHSAMSAGERADVWRGIRCGEFPIVIGARSAVFAPLKNLRLIVVDEEGDSSFKQNEPNPRYHARDVALVRAKMSGATAILGSATPSVESYYNAQKGRYNLLELPQRVENIPPPIIRFTATSKKKKKILGEELESAILERINAGEQVILLHNRRGFFTYVYCYHCGYVCRCKHCAITLTFHKTDSTLRCHLCGYSTTPQKECPECRGSLQYSGSGTQRLEDELVSIIPEEKIVRLDSDTTSRKRSHHRILKSFADKDYSVLLGTKMVARGHDYPSVTLVGAISTDAELLFPDFRSDERTFSLLLQAAGRAGRSAENGKRGEVLVQTWTPEHPVLQLLLAGDYRTFYEREIKLREGLHFPPYGWMVLFCFSSTNQERAEKYAKRFCQLANQKIRSGVWLGPNPAFRFRIKDLYRYQVLLKAHTSYRTLRSKLRLELKELITGCRAELPPSVHLTVDVDPIQIL